MEKRRRRQCHLIIIRWCCISFLFLRLTASRRVTKSTNEDLLQHVWREINRGGDRVSTPTTRYYEIYSKMTGNRVQMRGRRVDANGIAGSKYSKFAFISHTFGGNIMIRSIVTGRYLCMNKRGKLVGKKPSRINKLCVFTEKLAENYYDLFRSSARRNWLIGFRRNGKPKLGSRTATGQPEVMLLKMILREEPSRVHTNERQRFASLAKRFRNEFLSGHLSRAPGYEGASSGGQMLMDSPWSPAVSVSRHLPQAQPGYEEEEIAIRRKVASFLTNDTDVTLPPEPVYVSATSPEWSRARVPKKNKGRARKKSKKNRRRKRPKSRGRGKKLLTVQPTSVVAVDFDLDASTRGRTRSMKKLDRPNHDASSDVTGYHSGPKTSLRITHRPPTLSETPTLPTMLQAIRTKPTGKPRSPRRKTAKSNRKSMKRRNRRTKGRSGGAKT